MDISDAIFSVMCVDCSGYLAVNSITYRLMLFMKLLANTSDWPSPSHRYNMVGHLKFCLTLMGGYFLFHDVLNILQIFGILVAFLGMYYKILH